MNANVAHERYNHEAADDLIDRFKQRYGSFETQEDLEDERNYKLEASQRGLPNRASNWRPNAD